jgi:hypothetical protein
MGIFTIENMPEEETVMETLGESQPRLTKPHHFAQ